MSKLTAFACILSILVVDMVTKAWVHHTLPYMGLLPFFPYGGFSVFHDVYGVSFAIVHAVNHGAAWGFLQQAPQLLLMLRFGLLAWVFYGVFLSRDSRLRLPYALVLAGALGNVMDTVIYGHVVDFFLWIFGSYAYPVFNVADISICVGVGLVLMQGMYGTKCSYGK